MSKPEALSAPRPRTAAYPRTEIGESFLVNAEWHGPRCASNRTGMYRDCDCTLIREIVALEAEAAAIPAQDSRPLDVERLGNVVVGGDCLDSMGNPGWCQTHDAEYPEPWLYCRAYWEGVAAEYARLAAEKPEK